MQRTHGIEAGPDGTSIVRFGIAFWPYDLLLRFGYDLPENEHVWAGKWFDDHFEHAALGLRTDAAKLIRAIRGMDAALRALVRAACDAPVRDIQALQETVASAPLSLDLVLAYLRAILDGLAAVVPCCYGLDGRALLHARSSLRELAASSELARLDPELAALLSLAVELDIPTSASDLYVIAESGGYAAALPKAAARALRASAAITRRAGEQIDEALRTLCPWLDAVLAHLQRVVAARSEPGPELLERWAEPNWSVLLSLPAPAPALAAHLPLI